MKTSQAFRVVAPDYMGLARSLLVVLAFFSSGAVSAPLPPLSPAQKNYRKEIKTLFDSLEITESSLPSAVVEEGDKLAPTFNLSNKTNREIPVPLALGFPAERGGVMGYPVWTFVSADKKKRIPVTRQGVLAYASKVEPDGRIQVDASGVNGMGVSDLGLVPGEYLMTVRFLPFVGIPDAMLVSKPFKFEVKGSAQSKSATSPAGPRNPVSMAGSASKVRPANVPKASGGKASAASLVDSIGISNLQFASDRVLAGTTLSCSFDLTVDPSRPLPPADPDAPDASLKCGWSISRLGAQKASKAKVRIAGSIIPISEASVEELRKNGSMTLKLNNETSGLLPGEYQLALWLWQEGAKGERVAGARQEIGSFQITK